MGFLWEINFVEMFEKLLLNLKVSIEGRFFPILYAINNVFARDINLIIIIKGKAEDLMKLSYGLFKYLHILNTYSIICFMLKNTAFFEKVFCIKLAICSHHK